MEEKYKKLLALHNQEKKTKENEKDKGDDSYDESFDNDKNDLYHLKSPDSMELSINMPDVPEQETRKKLKKVSKVKYEDIKEVGKAF